MRVRALLTAGLAGCAALAACNGTSEEPAPEATEAAQTNLDAGRTAAGWAQLFDRPQAAIAAAREYGFRPGSYGPTGGEPPYQAKSDPITLSGAAPDSPNQASFTAEGAQGDRIDAVVFSLQLTDTESAAAAEQRFTDMIRRYLAKFDIRDDGKLLDAVTREENTDGMIAGTPVTVDTGVQTGAMPEVINVTFTRSDATSPDNSKPQG